MRVPIRLQLLLLVVLALLPALAVTIWSVADSVQDARRDGEKQCELVVERAATQVELLVAVTEQLLQDLARDPVVLQQDIPACNARFAGIQKAHPIYSSCQLAGVDGVILGSGTPMPGQVDVGDCKCCKDAVATGGFSVGEYIVGRTAQRPVINFAMPVKDDQGQAQAVLQVGVDLDQLGEMLAVARPQGIMMVAVDHGGTILYRSLDTGKWRGSSDVPERIRRMVPAPTGSDTGIGVDGIDRARFWRQVRLPGSEKPYLYIRAGIQQKELYAAAWTRFWNKSLLVVLAAAVSLLVAWQVGYRLVGQRLAKLVDVSARMASGDLSGRTGIRPHGDEISRLAGSFDLMAERIQERDLNLNQLNRRLVAISGCAQIVVRATNEGMLLSEICQTICDKAGYRMAWVGFAEQDEARTIRPVAWSGVEDGYFSGMELSWGDHENGRGPSGTAIRTGRPATWQDFNDLPETDPLRIAAIRHGYRSSVAVPLLGTDGIAIGVLSMDASQPGAFTPEEVQLLSELADDLAFGIVSLRTRAQRDRADVELRRARDEAIAANQAKDQFLAAASHELRTPLTPALLLVNSLEQDQSLPEFARDDLATVREHIEIEKRLIGDLLDFAAIRAGKLTLQPAEVDLHGVIRETLRICDEGFRIKEQTVNVYLEAGRFQVDGDRARLRQVLWNLLQNSAKYTPEKGRVCIRTSNTDQQITLEVSDNGMGIDVQTLGRLFTPFEQGPRTAVQHYGGLGLGLAISRAIVEAHGGLISAHSQGPGQGALFRVVLPLTQAGTSTDLKPAPESQLEPAQGLRILLVEDHLPTLAVMRRLLERDGHSVLLATTRAQALTQASTNGIDLVISDIALPDGTGLELMPILREQHGLRGIAVSGFGTDIDLQASREAGFCDHLVKPISIHALGQAIAKVAAMPV
jgi:signal transduction histidine kinase/CheY-like chemotaxis protein/HAMP domain-containing protein